jgi:hypothetical protein
MHFPCKEGYGGSSPLGSTFISLVSSVAEQEFVKLSVGGSIPSLGSHVGSSIGRAAVSKTAGCRFESCPLCIWSLSIAGDVPAL